MEIPGYKGNLVWLPSRTIFLTRHGSHAYGTNTPTSDLDLKGVAIPPREYFLGFAQHFEQAEVREPDMVIYELRKFMQLAADCNPNIIETLFTDPSDHLGVTALGEKLLAARDLFVSRRARYTFSGYAMAQMRRLETHYRWVKAPPPAPPRREDFGLAALSEDEEARLKALHGEIDRLVKTWDTDLSALPKDTQDELRERITEALSERVAAESESWRAASRHLGLNDETIHTLAREREFRARLREWEQFASWLKSRNPKRAEFEAKYGYDCYLDDTEFLTADSWKRYDEISEGDLLATLHPASGQVEYQHYTDRVAKSYSGTIGVVTARHTSCAVTLNHRMWVSACRRSPANGYSTAYVREEADWHFAKLDEILESRRSYFHVRVAASPKLDDDSSISDDFLILVGCYVSEGCVGKRLTNGTASVLRISQRSGGRLEPFMDGLMARNPDQIRRFSYTRDEDWRQHECQETVWTVADRGWAERIERECGSGSSTKRLPRWARGLSARQAHLLLDVLIAGDGTERPPVRIYYTASKRLAGDVQALCASTGIVSHVWGPYAYEHSPTAMYQVCIGEAKEAVPVAFREEESPSFHTEEVRDARIVCFTVPNELLVTRRNGKVAIQGNTKFGAHVVRLFRMCREILETGKVQVRRPDRDELIAIRNGAWSFEALRAFADAEDKATEGLYKASKLPHSPDRKALDALCVAMVDEALRTMS